MRRWLCSSLQCAVYVHQHCRLLYGIVGDGRQSGAVCGYPVRHATVHGQYEFDPEDGEHVLVQRGERSTFCDGQVQAAGHPAEPLWE